MKNKLMVLQSRTINSVSAWGIMALALAAAFLIMGCTRPAQNKNPAPNTGPKHEYKEIKPEIHPIPEGVKSALPGLLNDNIYIYREIAPTLNLVAYVPEYSLAGAAKMAAQAFVALSEQPEFREGIEFWIIQIQPETGKNEVPVKPVDGSSAESNALVFTWGVKPSEVDEYKKSENLINFLSNSEYLLVNDKIIPKGEERTTMFADLLPKPQSGTTAEPLNPSTGQTAQEPGDTVQPGETAPPEPGGDTVKPPAIKTGDTQQ